MSARLGRLWLLRTLRASPWLVLGPPVLLPLRSHVLGHPFGAQRANGTPSGPSVSGHYGHPSWVLRELRHHGPRDL